MVSCPQSLVWDGLITSKPVKIVDFVAIMQNQGIIECGSPEYGKKVMNNLNCVSYM